MQESDEYSGNEIGTIHLKITFPKIIYADLMLVDSSLGICQTIV
jgi:hypothetical protein